MVNRRDFLAKSVQASAVVAGASMVPSTIMAQSNVESVQDKKSYQHSVCRWCFQNIPLESFIEQIKPMGIHAIDLVGPDDWAILKKHGIDSSMCNGAEINLVDGFCDPQFHEELFYRYEPMIKRVADAGYKQLICFSGNARGISKWKGLSICAKGLDKLVRIAEDYDVTLVMELFNTAVDHPDYMCDSVEWGVALCDQFRSDAFKLLYDIYHMQIMEGNLIQTITDYHHYFSHYHTAGVPGRHEINNSQEINYPAVMKAIDATGFTGYVAQEFITTTEEPLDALREAIDICS